MIAGNNLPVMLRSGFRLVLFLVELAKEEVDGAFVGEVGRQQMLELGAAGGCVALLQGEHGDRIDDVRIVRVVLDQTVEMTACFVVAFLCDEQAGQGQAGVTSARVGVDEIVQAVDGGLRGTLGLQQGSGGAGGGTTQTASGDTVCASSLALAAAWAMAKWASGMSP